MKHHLTLSLFIGLLMSSCAVTIPETDITPPEFIFEITGGLPGGAVRITSAEDLSSKQLNLLRNSSYRFRYTGTDRGGLARLWMQVDWPTNFVGLAPTDVVVVTDGEFTREMFWNGDRDNPVSAQVITGSISTIIYNQSYSVVSMEFRFSAEDFGGVRGPANVTYNTLNVAMVDETQPLGMLSL